MTRHFAAGRLVLAAFSGTRHSTGTEVGRKRIWSSHAWYDSLPRMVSSLRVPSAFRLAGDPSIVTTCAMSNGFEVHEHCLGEWREEERLGRRELRCAEAQVRRGLHRERHDLILQLSRRVHVDAWPWLDEQPERQRRPQRRAWLARRRQGCKVVSSRGRRIDLGG